MDRTPNLTIKKTCKSFTSIRVSNLVFLKNLKHFLLISCFNSTQNHQFWFKWTEHMFLKGNQSTIESVVIVEFQYIPFSTFSPTGLDTTLLLPSETSAISIQTAGSTDSLSKPSSVFSGSKTL